MLTPAIRAMFELPLLLLVARVRADHEDASVAADDLALLTHRLDRRTYLHDPFRLSPGGAALETGAAAATAPRSEIAARDTTAPNATEQISKPPSGLWSARRRALRRPTRGPRARARG